MQRFSQSSFQLSLSFDHSFITGVLHGGSTWCFIKDLSHSRSVHWDYFQGSSSILHLAIRSAILSTLSFEMVLCLSWQFPFMFHESKVVRNEIFKPTNLFIGVILGYISPKAFPKDCCYCGAYNDPSSSFIIPVK